MDATALTRRIGEELELLRLALVRRDAAEIEERVSTVSRMIEQLGDRLLEHDGMEGIRETSRSCLALLRRGRAALQALQSLHDLFSADVTYRVGG